MGRLLRTSLVCALLLSVAAPTTAFGVSKDEQQITFWSLAVLPFDGQAGALSGPRAGARLAIGLRDTRHFKVIPPKRLLQALKELQIDPRSTQGSIAPADAKRLSKMLGVDGFVVGSVRPDRKRVRMSVSLVSGSGQLFGTYEFPVSEKFVRQESIRAALQLSQRLPYDGLIVRIDGKQALINVGASQGLKPQGKLYAFEFDKVRLKKKTGYAGGERKAIAELEVVRVSRFGAWVRAIRGPMPERLSKISLKAVEGEIEMPAPTGPVRKQPWLTFGAGVGFLTKNYILESSVATFSSETTFFPAPGIDVQVRAYNLNPSTFIGVNGGFRHGFIPFRRTVGTDVENFSGALDQGYVAAELNRSFGGDGRFQDTHLFGTLGYRFQAFTVEDQQPLVLTSDTYNQVTVGGGLIVPVFEILGQQRRRFFVFAKGAYIPLAFLSQAPVDNGASTSQGGYANFGVSFAWNKRLAITGTYGIDVIASNFDAAGGSRGLTDPSSRDFYQGFTLQMDYRLLR